MITVTIEVARQDLIDMGISHDGEQVECTINANCITCFYPSHDETKGITGTKIHLCDAERIWCYEPYLEVKRKVDMCNGRIHN